MHPIHALWAHPRSMSTALERVMRERGDLDCAHEPFMYDYYVHRRARPFPHFEVDPQRPASYAAIRDWLLARAAVRPVFFKDMAYYMVPHLLQDRAFCDRITHSFLIRDPMAAILSYHKLDPDFSDEEVGLRAQWQLFEGLRARGPAPPILIAEAVQADTRAVIGAWWRQIGLPYVEAAFDWQGKPRPTDWDEVGTWHQAATAAPGIRPPDPEAADRRMAEFAARAAAHPQLAAYLAAHRPCYERLRAAVGAGSRKPASAMSRSGAAGR